LNNRRVSSHIVKYKTNPRTIPKQHWHSREALIEHPLLSVSELKGNCFHIISS
jgi:hypothetical protein